MSGKMAPRVSLLACILLVAAVHSVSAIVVDHRVLFLTLNATTYGDFLKTTLQGMGVPYEVLTPANWTGQDMNTFLYNAGGTGRYSAMVLYPSVDLLGNMNSTHVQQVEAYCAATGARTARFGAWPWNFGFNPVPTADCTSLEQSMTWTSAVPKGISGLNTTTKLSANLLYRCPGTMPVVGAAYNSTPILTFDVNSTTGTYSTSTVAGTLVNYPDGRETMAFFMDMASWQISSMAIGHLVTSWLLHHIIPGERRAMLSTQVDDVFLSTALRNDALPTYRLTRADLIAHRDWSWQVNTWLPPKSDYTMELAYNGDGVLDAYGDPNTLRMPAYYCADDPLYVQLGCTCANTVQASCNNTAPFCQACTKDWKMPDAGTDHIPENYTDGLFNATAIQTRDPAAAEVFSNRATRNAFFWVSHTFQHQSLGNASFNDCYKQWYLNKIIGNYLNMAPATGLSKKVVVTPQISGLSNANNYKALKNQSYTAVIGDNTWPYLRNVQNPYQSLKTTVQTNGATGFRIIPRFASELYFNVGFRQGEEDLYNTLYSSFYGYNSTLDQILDREAYRVVRDGLLGLRHDAHMFHQANMAIPAGGSKSLLMMWVERVLTKYLTLVNWPVETLMADDLMWHYVDREQRDACKLTYSLDINMATRAVNSITVKSGAGSDTCSVPLMVPAGASVTGPGAGARASPEVLSLLGNVTAGTSVTYPTASLTW